MAATSPQLLGFAVPVTQVPPVEGFLEPDEDAETPPVDAAQAEPAEPEPAPSPEPERSAVPDPESASVETQAHDAPPEVVLPPRPQNLVGRLGRRLGETRAVPEPHRLPLSPRFAPPAEAVPGAVPSRSREPASPASRFAPPPDTPAPDFHRTREAPQRLAEPPPPAVERAGRPSLPHNRRLHRRAKLPAEIEIDGVPCTLIDVSIGGFAATGVPYQVEPNALVPMTLRLTIDGIEVGTRLKARILYVTQGRSSGRFVELSPSQMAFLRYIVTWRGESVGAVGTTTLLDAISGVAPGSGSRADVDTKSRWWAGLIGRKINPPR
jgi:hypothetical protein